jgi:hypothetical protein
MKEAKLNDLEKSLESGLISQEEYQIKKKEIEEMPEPVAEEVEEVKHSKSDKKLVVLAGGLILIFAALLGYQYLTIEEPPSTIEEMHELNYERKLKDDQGYLYNDVFSFVLFEDLWYTQLRSPQGTRLYDIQFRFGPKEVEDIEIQGALNTNLLNDAAEYFVTFNPTGENFSSVALAVGDFNQHMVKIFFKQPIAACDRNETFSCRSRPIITCENTDELVLYVKESNRTGVRFTDNCILVEGSGLDLVKGVDRVLYEFYGVIQ